MTQKKQRGRPRKKTTAAKVRANSAAVDTAKPSGDPLASVENLANDLVSSVRNMIPKKEESSSPEQQQPSSQPFPVDDGSIPSPKTSSEVNDVRQLAQTVAKIKEDFGGGNTQTSPQAEKSWNAGDSFSSGGGTRSSESSRPDIGPGVVEPPDHDFIPRETVREILELIFSATGKPLAPTESRSLSPLTVDMTNEQGPRLFGNSENRAWWLWVGVMTIFIAVRSEAGARLIEWISDAVTGAGKSKVAKPKEENKAESKPAADAKKASTQPVADSTSPGSLAFKEDSGFQVPAKQP